jgi:hypothetical protein
MLAIGDVGVGYLQLAGAVGDLLDLPLLGGVEAGVVDGDRRLVGDDLDQGLLDRREGLDLLPRDGQCPHQAPGRLQRHDQDRPRRVAHLEVLETTVLGRVVDRDDLSLLGCPANDPLPQLETGHLADRLGEGERRDRGEGAIVLVEEKNGGRVTDSQVAGRLEHEIDGLLQLKAGRKKIAHLAEEVDDDLIVHPPRV